MTYSPTLHKYAITFTFFRTSQKRYKSKYIASYYLGDDYTGQQRYIVVLTEHANWPEVKKKQRK